MEKYLYFRCAKEFNPIHVIERKMSMIGAKSVF